MIHPTSNRLSGRVAIVTGGARGIGRAIAETLIQQGAKVLVADPGTGIDGHGADPSVAAEVQRELGENALVLAESIAAPDAARALVDRAVSAFGGVDILINNAAIMRDAFVFKADPGDWEAVVRANLSAAFYMTRWVSERQREQQKAGRGGGDYRWGRIVNITSSAGLYGNFGQAPYASAKAGLVGLTRVTALDMARSHVTCNAVAPFAATRVTLSIQPQNEAQAQYKARALRVLPRHVANVVAYLAGDQAAGVTGQLFGVRGREVFLFSQPRPVARIAATDEWTPEALAKAVEAEFAPAFTSPATDLEAFNTEPLA